MLFGYAMPAQAQAVCGDRAEIVDRLAETYQEKATAAGLSGNGGIVELYLSADDSWTLLITYPTGIACLIAGGEHWQAVVPPAGGAT